MYTLIAARMWLHARTHRFLLRRPRGSLRFDGPENCGDTRSHALFLAHLVADWCRTCSFNDGREMLSLTLRFSEKNQNVQNATLKYPFILPHVGKERN